LEILGGILAIGGWILFAAALLGGLILSMVGLFGSWIILAAVVIAYAASGFQYFSIWGMAILLALAILGEVLETGASAMGASRFGGSRGGMVAAVVGCIVGAIIGSPFLLIIGAIIGACLGAFIGATLYEFIVMERDAGDAAYTGFGAALGKVAGMLLKFLIALIMVLVLSLDLFVF
jgi:uncharacterized protein YqgC (DUF456 family)